MQTLRAMMKVGNQITESSAKKMDSLQVPLLSSKPCIVNVLATLVCCEAVSIYGVLRM